MAQVRRLSVEMPSKVKEYQEHLAERARISAQLKGEISKDVVQKFQHGNEFTDLLDKMQYVTVCRTSPNQESNCWLRPRLCNCGCMFMSRV